MISACVEGKCKEWLLKCCLVLPSRVEDYEVIELDAIISLYINIQFLCASDHKIRVRGLGPLSHKCRSRSLGIS